MLGREKNERREKLSNTQEAVTFHSYSGFRARLLLTQRTKDP